MDSSSNQSLLLAVAPELRNQIYFATLATGDVHITSADGSAKAQYPALLQTCGQIRSEAFEIYYITNTFHLEVFEYDTSKAAAWITSLPPKAGPLISNMIIEITSKREDDGTVSSLGEQAKETWEELGKALSEAEIQMGQVTIRLAKDYEDRFSRVARSSFFGEFVASIARSITRMATMHLMRGMGFTVRNTSAGFRSLKIERRRF